jgi:hypothetical protein
MRDDLNALEWKQFWINKCTFCLLQSEPEGDHEIYNRRAGIIEKIRNEGIHSASKSDAIMSTVRLKLFH